jgi:Cu-Zn family superoxide dismutase
MHRSKGIWIFPLAMLLTLAGCGRNEEGTEGEGAETTGAETTDTGTLAVPTAPVAHTAQATLQGAPGDTDFSGTVTLYHEGNGVRVVADFAGVDTPGKHGFHVHETGECAHDEAGGKHFSSAGGHFNPTGAEHACPPTEPRHAGDLGNIEIGANGSGHAELTTGLLSLDGANSVVGKAIILHTGEDDCKTQPTGNAGDRLACGVVTAGQ